MNLKYLLIILIAGKLSSQKISGKILTEKKEPVSDARIGISNEDIGGITDKDGNYSIDISTVESSKILKVVVNGYEPFQIKLSDFAALKNHSIFLKEKSMNIEEVHIIPKKYVAKNFGTKNSKRVYCGYNSEDVNKIFQEYAIKVRNNKKLKIKKINVELSSVALEKPALLIFDVQNSINDYPGTSVVNETLKLTISNENIQNNRISLDVSDKNIWLNEDFFISVRISEDFKGKMYFGGNIFAFSKSTYFRNYFGEWKKYSSGEPSINVDVLVEK
ncbi:carboxypeptidase-like regulatory domain-containing protein [Chryseobacterium soli]|uniref:carboxypeptidase-like regulatory domain-containing protein n=1 Tax=Chryseobacterium soli TaxID=445961 RepID=UPI002954E8A0|nr:carboxypeptidase-like regulatory domain-containing protein [Chryseobacterium soli]MDV7695724.1 carboxypeptidase-like regulatory domain-containing protein [Chryseobacterium soli]